MTDPMTHPVSDTPSLALPAVPWSTSTCNLDPTAAEIVAKVVIRCPSASFKSLYRAVADDTVDRVRRDASARATAALDVQRHIEIERQLAEVGRQVRELTLEADRLTADKITLAEATDNDVVSSLAEVNRRLSEVRVALATRQHELNDATEHFATLKNTAKEAIVKEIEEARRAANRANDTERKAIFAELAGLVSPLLTRLRVLDMRNATLNTTVKVTIKPDQILAGVLRDALGDSAKDDTPTPVVEAVKDEPPPVVEEPTAKRGKVRKTEAVTS